ncbi:general substrate transporter [Gongronella butleri]|nr:general substrate transporter [Gongronella butleri]
MITKKRFFCYLYGICAALCMYINGYDASVFNNLQGLDSFMGYVGLNSKDPKDQNLIGAVTSTYLAASIVAGLFVAPFLSDRMGRRAALFIGCFVVIVASVIQTWSPNLGAFIAGRMVLGLGQGIALPVGPVFMGEICPPDVRGRMISFWQMMYSVGALVVSYITFGTSNDKSLGNWQWKIVTLLQALVPLVCCIGILFCPESPRWLVKKGKIDQARRALARVREDHEVEPELEEIQAALEWEAMNTTNSIKDLWGERSIRRRMILCLIINFGQQITGQSMMNNYSTTVYKKVFTDNSTILLINALNYTFGILFTFTCTLFSDRLGRTTMLIVAAIGQAAMLLIAATLYIASPTDAAGHKSTGIGAGLVASMYLFTFFYKPGWGATVWIYTSEVFPMSVRSIAVSICTNTQNVSNLIMAQAFPPMFTAMGFYAFYVWMGCNIVLAILVWRFYPEPRRVPLEKMDALFGSQEKTDAVMATHKHHDDVYIHDEKA